MSDSIGHELIRTYVRRNAIILIAQILIAARGLVLAPLLVKTFGTGVYGTYVLLVGFTGFVFGISGFGAGYRFSRHAPSTEDLAWRRSLFCGALLFNLITVTAIAAALLLTHPLLEAMILKRRFPFPIGPVVLLLISQTVFHHITNYFRYTHRIRTYVLISTAAAYAFMAVVYLTARAGGYLDVGRIILLQTGSILLVAPIPIILAARELWFPGGILERYDLREDLRVGLPVVAMFVVDYALSNSDRLLLGVFHTVESVGAYNAAYVVGTAAIVVPKALGVAVPALLARAEDSSNRSEVSLLMSVSMRTVLLFSVPFVAGTVVYGWDVLALLMTDEVADMAYPATVAVAAAIVFYGLFTVRGFLLYVKQRTLALFAAAAAAAGLNVGLNVVLLPFYGNILVPALTTLAAYVVAYLIVRHATAKDDVPTLPPWFLIRVVAASASIVAFRPLVAASGSPGVLAACVIGSSLLCLGLLVAFGVIPKHVLSAVFPSRAGRDL